MKKGNIKEVICYDIWVVRGRSQTPIFNSKPMYMESISLKNMMATGFHTPIALQVMLWKSDNMV